MWKRSMFVVVICASFYFGVYGAQLLAAGYSKKSCESSTPCPQWICDRSGGSGRCSTCGCIFTTCKFTNCGICQTNYFSLCCRQNNSCSGQDVGVSPPVSCTCGAMTFPNNQNRTIPFCQRKPSIWTLFASWTIA